MNKYEDLYGRVRSHLYIAQGFMIGLAVLFEEDENGHDMSTVEDMRQELDNLISEWNEMPGLLVGEQI